MSGILWTVLGIAAYLCGVLVLARCIEWGMDDGHK